MAIVNFDQFRDSDFVPSVSSVVPSDYNKLAKHLAGNIHQKLEQLSKTGAEVEVFGPDWSRENKSTICACVNHTVSSSGEILTSSSNCSSLKVTILGIGKTPFPITNGDDL